MSDKVSGAPYIEEREYDNIKIKYENIAVNLKQSVIALLKTANIDFLDVQYRVKEYNSFINKIERKEYTDISQVEDLCGIRIICFYHSDLKKICNLIKTEFEVLEFIDKSVLLGKDKFGYRSIHFIVNIKDDWKKIPNYRNIENAKIEIQVRTILMHAWADIEHKLAYKKEEDAPVEFRRKFSQLSSLLEIADEQFSQLRNSREEYIKSLVERNVEVFDYNQVFNLDSLQAFMDFYFPKKPRSLQETANLFYELKRKGINLHDLHISYIKAKNYLPQIEEDIGKLYTFKSGGWAQVGAVRAMLDVASDKYWSYREKISPRENVILFRKWRDVITKENK